MEAELQGELEHSNLTGRCGRDRKVADDAAVPVDNDTVNCLDVDPERGRCDLLFITLVFRYSMLLYKRHFFKKISQSDPYPNPHCIPY